MPTWEITVESLKHGIPIIMEVEADNEDMLDPTFLSSEADRIYEGQQVIQEDQRKESARQAETNLLPTPVDPTVKSAITGALGPGLGGVADKVAPLAGAAATGILDTAAGIPSNVMKALGYPSASPFSSAPVESEDMFSPQAENPGTYGVGNLIGGMATMGGGPKSTGMIAPVGIAGGVPSVARRLGTAMVGGGRMGGILGTGAGVGEALRENPVPAEGEEVVQFGSAGEPGSFEARPELLMEALPSTVVGAGLGATAGGLASGIPAAIRPFTNAGRKEKMIKLLQGRAKPTARSRTGQNFDEVAEDFMLHANEGRPVVNTVDDGIAAGENALNKISTTRIEPMIVGAEQRGVQIDLTAAAQNIERLSKEPYYRYLDPEGAAKLIDEAGLLTGKNVPVRDAQSLLTFLNKRARAIRQKTGTSADVNESRAMETLAESYEEMADGIRRQLNERVSRSPNEFLEAYRNWANVDEVTDLLKIAKVRQGNTPDEQLLRVVSDSLPRRDVSILGKLLPGQTTDTDVSKAFRLAGKIKMNPATPFGPQKPSMLPQPPPTPGGGGTGGGGPPSTPITPVQGTPRGQAWATANVPPATPAPAPVTPTPTPATPPPTSPLQPPRDIVQENLGSARSGQESGAIPMRAKAAIQQKLLDDAGVAPDDLGNFIQKHGAEMSDLATLVQRGEISHIEAVTHLNKLYKQLKPGAEPFGHILNPPTSGKPFVPINLTPSSGDVFLDPPVPKGGGRQNFIGPSASNLPDWTKNAIKASKDMDVVDAYKDVQSAANVLLGKHKMSPNQVLNDPSVSYFAKQLLKDALAHPDRKQSFVFLRMLEAHLKRRMDSSLGRTEGPGYGALEKPTTENVPIEGEVGDLLEPPKSVFEGRPSPAPLPPTPGIPRPPTPGSSATQMGGRSRHPETRANVFRGSHDSVEVIFKDKADKIAFGGGKKPSRIVKGEYQSSASQTKKASEHFKTIYPKAELRQISAAMRDYNKFIVDLAGLQEKSGANLKIEPLTFDEFVKTQYPSIFGK